METKEDVEVERMEDIIRPEKETQWEPSDILDMIRKNKQIRIITMAGAGISTSAGIRDFRSEDGIFSLPEVKKLKLNKDEDLFHIDFFREHPTLFYKAVVDIFSQEYEPTLSHYFIRLLAEKGLLLRHYTQNVDALEEKAGLTEEHVVYSHGRIFPGVCLDCKRSVPEAEMREHFSTPPLRAMVCECGGLIKPGVTLYGEQVSAAVFERSMSDFEKCDLLIVMGSSLQVIPFCFLTDMVSDNVPRLLINREPAGFVGLDEDSELTFERNTDVALVGECDELVMQICKSLKWDKELLALKENSEDKKDPEEQEGKALQSLATFAQSPIPSVGLSSASCNINQGNERSQGHLDLPRLISLASQGKSDKQDSSSSIDSSK